MKLKITQGVNPNDGHDIFYVYEWQPSTTDPQSGRWAYRYGSHVEQEAHDYVARVTNPVAERTIREIEV